jgi:hypothetical protein
VATPSSDVHLGGLECIEIHVISAKHESCALSAAIEIGV